MAVAGQVGQPRPRAKREKIDGLRAARGFAEKRQPFAPGEGVDRARFADIRSSREGDFEPCLGREITWLGGRGEETRLQECGQEIDGMPKGGNSNKIAAFHRRIQGAVA